MWDSLLTGNLAGVFGFGFYQYGFVYFFLTLLSAIPGLLFDQTWLAILGPRIISSIFAVGTLVVIYQFFREKFDPLTCILGSSLLLTMPAFWYNATWFHPDWPMAFFIITFAFFLYRDNWRYDTNFWIGVVFFALAIAFKYQALTFTPLLGLYLLYPILNKLNWSNIINCIQRTLISAGIIASIFVFLNPYVLHPMGFRVFSRHCCQLPPPSNPKPLLKML